MNQDFIKRFQGYILLYPSIYSIGGQQTLVLSAGLDSQLQQQIQFNTNAITFITLLTSSLQSYGSLSDGRNPFVSIITAVMGSLGRDHRKVGQHLLDELGAGIFKEPIQKAHPETTGTSDIIYELMELSRQCEAMSSQIKRVCDVLQAI